MKTAAIGKQVGRRGLLPTILLASMVGNFTAPSAAASEAKWEGRSALRPEPPRVIPQLLGQGTSKLVGTNPQFYLELDAFTGTASPVSGLGLGGFRGVEGLAFDPNTNTLYGTNVYSDELITIDLATGAGTSVGALGFPHVAGLAFDPNTDTLYGTDADSGQLVTIDPTTGAGTAVGAVGFSWVAGLAFDPNTNTLYGVNAYGGQLIGIDPTTGAGTAIGTLGFSNVAGLAFDANTNTLYGTDDGSNQLITIDTATGAGTAVGAMEFQQVVSLSFDSNTNTLHGTDAYSGELIIIDPATGEATPIGSLGFSRVDGLAFDPNTDTLYGTDEGSDQLITIDPATGIGTAIGHLGFSRVAGLAFDPTTDTLYGTDVGSDQLITIDPATGAGTAVGPLGFSRVAGLAFDSNSDALYGTDVDSGQLVTIDPTTGAGTAIGAPGFSWVSGLTFDPNTDTLYGTDADSGQLITIDPVTGAGTEIGAMGFSGVGGLAFDPNSNTLYGTDTNSGQLITIAPAMGTGTAVGGLGFSWVSGLAFNPNTGTLYAADAASDHLITIDPTTGEGTAVGAMGFPYVEGLAFDPNTNTLYGTDTGSGELITIDPATGAGTPVGALGFSNVKGLAFDPNTNTLYGADVQSGQLITIDPATGAGTVVGAVGFSWVDGLAFDPNNGTLYGTDRLTDELIMIDPATGEGTAIGPMRYLDIFGLAFIPAGCDSDADCDDGDPCTDDTCPSGACIYTQNEAPCDDGDNCTENDACFAGSCTGDDVDCSHSDDDCNVGSCDPSDGSCFVESAYEGESCDDDDNCTENDACITGSCIGADVDCSHLDDDCNVGTCDPSDGICFVESAHEDGPCDDGVFCNGADSCSEGACSEHEGDPCAEWGVSCDQENDVCDCDPPPASENPAPADGEEGMPRDIQLTWNGFDSLFRLLAGTGSDGPNSFSLVELRTNPVEEVLIGPLGFLPILDFDPSGVLYGAGSNLSIVDPNDGSIVTTIGTIHSASEPELFVSGIAFAPDGTLYGVAHLFSDDPPGPDGPLLISLYIIDPATAFAEEVGTISAIVWAIDFAPDGTLYGAFGDLMVLDRETGAVIESIGNMGTGIFVTDIDFAPDGSIYGVDNDPPSLFQINPDTATATQVGEYESRLWSVASEVLTGESAHGSGGQAARGLAAQPRDDVYGRRLGVAGTISDGRDLEYRAGVLRRLADRQSLLEARMPNLATDGLVDDPAPTGESSSCPTEYDVYLGLTPTEMDLICPDLDAPACSTGLLEYGTVYYWQVIAKSCCGETPGPVWSFTTVLCSSDTECDDGVFCNGAEVCDPVAGTCLSGPLPDCDDGVSCTNDTCQAATDSCQHLPDDAQCDDGEFCTGAEICDPSNGCQDGDEPCPGTECDEDLDACICDSDDDCEFLADLCNTGACDQEVGLCERMPANEGESCDDGVFCNGHETCVVGVCQAGTDPCSPGQNCDETADSCDIPPPPPSGGGGGSAPPEEHPSASGEVDANGVVVVDVTSDDGSIVAAVDVSNATQGAAVVVTLIINDSVPGLSGEATFDGFNAAIALGTTLEVSSELQAGTFVVVIRVTVPREALDALGVDPDEVDLHVFDETAGEWIRAGDTFVGASAPTDAPGEYGYDANNANDTVTYWAVRTALSVFAIGQSADGPSEIPLDPAQSESDSEPEPEPEPEQDPEPEPNPEPDSEPEPDFEPDSVTQPTPAPDDEDGAAPPILATPQCGAGGAPCGVLGMLNLSLMMLGIASMRRMRRIR